MISISISFEPAELQVAKEMLSGLASNLPIKVEPVPAGAALPEAKSEQSEKIQILKKRKASKSAKVPLTDEQKAQILEMHAKGFGIQDIKISLGIKDARQVWGWIMRSKGMLDAKNACPVEASQSPAAEVKQEEVQSSKNAPESARTEATHSDAPQAKPYTRAVLNGAIWDMHRAGKNADEISDELYKQGYCFSADFVKDRIKKIKKGAA